jgi:5-formyltetrahydrofolate cyclo-ligase
MRRVAGPSTADSARIVDGIAGWLSQRRPGRVAAFLAMPGEVDLEPLFERLPEWHWALPRVGSDRMMSFRDAGSEREPHRFGMWQPVDAGPVIPVAEISVFLVPGLAFDRRGNRLGNGAGHYDRALAAAPDADTIGMAPVSRIVDAVPTDSHDVPVRWLALEDEVIAVLPSP